VVVVDLTEEESKVALATHDPLAMMATADQGQLLNLLQSTQFEDRAVNDMLAALANGERLPDLTAPVDDPGPQIDRADELRQKWQTERGQVWEVGRHRLMCGDATSPEDVAETLNGASPPLMVTDPPYGVNYDPAWRNEAADKGLISYGATRVGEVKNDDRSDWREAFYLHRGAVAYVWHAGQHASEVQASLEAVGFELRSQIIWGKPSFAISRGHYNWQHEPCWYAVRKGHSASWIGDHSQSSLWSIARPVDTGLTHGTEKPLECMARPIRNHVGEVYDPFLGSGTTMVAAEQLGRICYGMEIEPKYVAVTLERMAGMGLEPRLVTG
jgi:DNA modification methylase